MDGSKGLTEREEGDAAEEAGDGKKNKTPGGQEGGASGSDAILAAGSARMPWAAPGTKPKVVYHDPSIPRPQDVYLIRVNNCNSPFDHVWLERSEDGTRPIHPLVSASCLLRSSFFCGWY